MKRKLWVLVTILAAAAVVASPAFGESKDLDARIVAPGSKISGKFIGEWTESWWG